jgi:hypothetical protein
MALYERGTLVLVPNHPRVTSGGSSTNTAAPAAAAVVMVVAVNHVSAIEGTVNRLG